MNQTDNRTVVVTGGNSGMGREIARAFVNKGSQIIIIGRNEDTMRQTAEELGETVSWYRADVSKREEVTAIVSAIIDRHRQIDVLVNCAGFGRSGTTELPLKKAEAIWNDVVNSNLKGSFLMAVACAPHLTCPGGRIINISSIAAYSGGSSPGSLAYASAKAGVIGLTLSLARELSSQGVTANAVAPGFITGTGFFGSDGLPEERVQAIVSQTPVGRPGRPEDVAAAVTYLASPEASFVTDEVLNVNGGWLFGR